jgi:hypothetical protein
MLGRKATPRAAIYLTCLFGGEGSAGANVVRFRMSRERAERVWGGCFSSG